MPGVGFYNRGEVGGRSVGGRWQLSHVGGLCVVLSCCCFTVGGAETWAEEGGRPTMEWSRPTLYNIYRCTFSSRWCSFMLVHCLPEDLGQWLTRGANRPEVGLVGQKFDYFFWCNVKENVMEIKREIETCYDLIKENIIIKLSHMPMQNKWEVHTNAYHEGSGFVSWVGLSLPSYIVVSFDGDAFFDFLGWWSLFNLLLSASRAILRWILRLALM